MADEPQAPKGWLPPQAPGAQEPPRFAPPAFAPPLRASSAPMLGAVAGASVLQATTSESPPRVSPAVPTLRMVPMRMRSPR